LGLECWLQDWVDGIPLHKAKDFFIARLDQRSSQNTRKILPQAEIIAVDFTGANPPAADPAASPKRRESIFAPLEEFVLDQPAFIRWYSAATGLAVVRGILARLGDATQRTGAPANLSPADEAQLWQMVKDQLEQLEQILMGAQKAGSRFLLVYESE
jgi:hypothetical protein